MVSKLLDSEGIVVQPPLDEAGRDDWLVFSMPTLPEVKQQRAEPRPSDAWFAHLEQLRPGSEREVEMHFAAPLFQALGYTEEQEAARFGVTVWDGASHHRSEADLVYFATDEHDLDHGEPLVLIECKMPGKGPDVGLGQVRSYAFWIKPAYYVITDGENLAVWNYQGGAVPDVRVIEVKSGQLREWFDDLYATLNPKAALKARREKAVRLSRPRTGS
jgi:Type I restriction enzyme R protein N terminus (HSDR_N)